MGLHDSIREIVSEKLRSARTRGDDFCVLISGDIHKEMKLENRMPAVCSVMKQLMGPNDQILHTTPKGNISTIKINYQLN